MSANPLSKYPPCHCCGGVVDPYRHGFNSKGYFCQTCWWCPDCEHHICVCPDELEDES